MTFLVRLTIFFVVIFAAAEASACTTRSSFFEAHGEGQVAQLREATSKANAKTIRSGWCPITDRIFAHRGELWFGIDNRATESEPRYAIVKIFRKSRSTKKRPRAFLHRLGTWQNDRCRTSTRRARFRIDVSPARYSTMFANMGTGEDAKCSKIDQWDGEAFGEGSLRISNEIRFLSRLPAGITLASQSNWQLQVVAYSYATSDVQESMWSNDFNDSLAVFRIAQFEAEEARIQIQISDGRYKEFSIVW